MNDSKNFAPRSYVRLTCTFVVGLATASCVKTTVTPLNQTPRPLTSRSPESVEVFTTKLPTRPYVEVSLIQAERVDASRHLAAMRKKAARIGCDAIVLNSLGSNTTVSATSYAQAHSGHSRATYASYGSGDAVSGSASTCIVWTTAPEVLAHTGDQMPPAPLPVPPTAPQRGPANVRLSYAANSQACLPEHSFAAEVAAKLGYWPWASDGVDFMTVDIRLAERTYVATLSLADQAAKQLTAPSCTLVTDALVASIVTHMELARAATRP